MTLVHQPRPRKESVIFDDVLPKGLPHAELTENARIVLGKRYLKKNAAGEPNEEPEVMFWRVARTIAAVDADYGASEQVVDEIARREAAIEARKAAAEENQRLERRRLRKELRQRRHDRLDELRQRRHDRLDAFMGLPRLTSL